MKVLEEKQIRNKLLMYFDIEYRKTRLKHIELPFSWKEFADYIAVNRGVRTGLFECPAVLLFAPCTFSNTSFKRLAGHGNGRCLTLPPPAGLISAFSRKRNEAY